MDHIGINIEKNDPHWLDSETHTIPASRITFTRDNNFSKALFMCNSWPYWSYWQILLLFIKCNLMTLFKIFYLFKIARWLHRRVRSVTFVTSQFTLSWPLPFAKQCIKYSKLHTFDRLLCTKTYRSLTPQGVHCKEQMSLISTSLT